VTHTSAESPPPGPGPDPEPALLRARVVSLYLLMAGYVPSRGFDSPLGICWLAAAVALLVAIAVVQRRHHAGNLLVALPAVTGIALAAALVAPATGWSITVAGAACLAAAGLALRRPLARAYEGARALPGSPVAVVLGLAAASCYFMISMRSASSVVLVVVTIALAWRVRGPGPGSGSGSIRGSAREVALSGTVLLCVCLAYESYARLFLLEFGTVAVPYPLDVVAWAVALLLAGSYLHDALAERPPGPPADPPRDETGGATWRRYRFVALALLAIGLREIIVLGLRDPKIDVHTTTHEACRLLAQGRNPYASPMPYPYPDLGKLGYPADMSDAFTYPPATVLLTLPAWMVLGDMRQAYVGIDVVVALICLALAGAGARDWRSLPVPVEIGVLLYLYSPAWPLVLSQAWTEPLLFAFAAAFVLAVRKRALLAGFVSLGVAAATKQYGVLFCAFAMRVRGARAGHLTGAIAMASAICLPFLVWNPAEFIRDITIQFRFLPRRDALNLANYLASLGLTLDPTLALVLALGSLAGLVRIQGRSPGQFVDALAAFLLIFFLLWKQAFANYFWLVHSLVVLGLVMKTTVPVARAGGDDCFHRAAAL
jgi:hypothetical protein